MNMQVKQQNSAKMFLDAIKRSNKPKDNVIKTGELFENYFKFCKLKKLDPMRPSEFWAQIEALCPNLDPTRPSYTLGELQAIIFVDLNENQVLPKFVSILKPQKMWIETSDHPNQENIFYAFYKDLSEKPWPADQTVRGDDLYRLYEEFCTQYKYAIRLVPDKFWEWTKREFRDGNGEPLDWRRNYTFDELRSIIVANPNIAPF